jgi:hypothetical protein
MTEITFADCVLKSHRTGSKYICNPPVMNTDDDLVILVNGYLNWQNLLVRDGWEVCGDYSGDEDIDPDFQAFRKGDKNYICTEDPDLFDRYVFATEGAKALNLRDKEQRINLFQAVKWAQHDFSGLPDNAKFQIKDPVNRIYGKYFKKVVGHRYDPVDLDF